MAIKVFSSGTPAAQLRGAGGAATQSAGLDVSDTAASRLTQTALESVKGVSDSFLKKAIKDEETKQASDILDEANSYYEDTRKFEHEYRLEKRGAEARSAAADYEEFHRKQYNSRAMRFAGDPRMTFMWKRQASQIMMGSTGRGMVYSEQQDKAYRADVTKTKTDLYYQKIAEAPSDAAVNALRSQYNAEIRAINTPEQSDHIMNVADQQTALTRINTAIAVNDVQEAQRLLGEYKEAGVLGTQTDEMTKKVEDARIEDDAFNISVEIRNTMPEATKTEKLDKVQELAGDDDKVYQSARDQVNKDHSAQVSLQKEQDQLIIDMFSNKSAAAVTPEEREAVKQEILITPMTSTVRTKILATNAKGLKQPLTSNDAKLREAEQRVASESITQEQLEREFKWHLSKQDYDLQADRLKTTGGNRVNAYNLEMEDRLSRAFAEDGKKKKTKTKRFKNAMNQFSKEFETQNGRLPGNKDLKDQEDFLMKQVIYDEDIIFHDTIERFMIDTLDPSKFDVPDKFKADISRDLKNANIEPTRAKIIEIYKLYLMDRPND